MPKTKLKDIIKPGAKIKCEPINWDSPEVKKRFELMLKEKEESKARKNVDWSKLYKHMNI
jgi:hypothetical protein